MNKFLSALAISGSLISTQPNLGGSQKEHCPTPQQEKKVEEILPYPPSTDPSNPNNWAETLWYTDKTKFVSVYYNYYDTPECVTLIKEFRKEIGVHFTKVGLIETPMKFLPESTHETVQYPDVYITLACGSELNKGRITRKDGEIFLSIGGTEGAVMWKNNKQSDIKNIPDMVRWWTRLILGGTEI